VYVSRGRIRRTRVPVTVASALDARIGSPGGFRGEPLGDPARPRADAAGAGRRHRAALLRGPRPRAGLWVALWTAAIAAEALALKPVLFPDEGTFEWLNLVFTLVGGSFAAFGLEAWRRRPDSRRGMLMTATGFGFFVAPLLGQLDLPLAHTLRVLAVDGWIFFFFVTLILTLLTRGRLQSRFDRLLVASFALPLVILQVAWMLFDPDDGHLLLAWPDADVAHVIDRLQRGLLVCSCAVTAAVIARRWGTSPRPRRRALLPSLAGALVLTFFAALLVNDLIWGTPSQALLWIAACSLVGVPAAFLAGQLRSRLARGALAELFLGLGTNCGGHLEGALARTLGDPGLTIAYWLPEYRSCASSVERVGSRARIQIADDGVGGADDSRGSGLRGLADRIEALDGTLSVSSPPGIGTTVTAELPCGS